MALKITRAVLEGLTAHAVDAAPLECCGLLAGSGEVIDEFVRTPNIRASEVAYEIDPRDHIAIRKSLRRRGRSVLGAYHSHPRSPAVPSPTDTAEAHYDGGFLYVIVSLEGSPPDIRAYRVERGTLIETNFETLL